MHRERWDAVGGYDERFAGYYGTDADFRDRLIRDGRIISLNLPLLRVPRDVIPDASTTFYTRKEMWDREKITEIKARRERMQPDRPKTLTFPWQRVG